MFVYASSLSADCEVYWLRLHGKDEKQQLILPQTFPLDQFINNKLAWEPVVYDEQGRYFRNSPTSVLFWIPLTQPATVTSLGRLDGRTIYHAKYSDLSIAILYEAGEGALCPALILDADAYGSAGQVVELLGTPEIFEFRGADLLSLRIYYKGNGAHQESLLFRLIDRQLVYLKQQPFYEAIAALGWEMSWHGGGFCKNSLTFGIGIGPIGSYGIVEVHSSLILLQSEIIEWIYMARHYFLLSSSHIKYRNLG